MVSEVRVVHLCGELDIASVDELDRALRDVPPTSHLVVDLAEVTFVDSVVLNRFVQAARWHDGLGTTVVLAGAVGIVRRVLAITELDAVLHCTATVREAEAFLGAEPDGV